MRPQFSTAPSVGIFDSGVGGLSVLKALRRETPAIDFIYVADSAHAPYGSREPEFIQARAHLIADTLVGAGAKIIVVACNTATAVAIESLRAQLAVPIVAMEPAIKPAVACTRSGVVGVLATERTLDSPALAKLCSRYGQGVELLLQPCPGLVEQVERGELASAPTRELLQGYLSPLLARGTDTIVLGCTHYVFLEPAIRAIAGPDVQIIESSAAVARQAIRQLGDGVFAAAKDREGRETFLTTGAVAPAGDFFSQLWGARVEVGALQSLRPPAPA